MTIPRSECSIAKRLRTFGTWSIRWSAIQVDFTGQQSGPKWPRDNNLIPNVGAHPQAHRNHQNLVVILRGNGRAERSGTEHRTPNPERSPMMLPLIGERRHGAARPLGTGGLIPDTSSPSRSTQSRSFVTTSPQISRPRRVVTPGPSPGPRSRALAALGPGRKFRPGSCSAGTTDSSRPSSSSR